MKRKDIIILIIFALSSIVIYVWSSIAKKKFVERSKYTEATVVSEFHYRKTSGGSGYDYIFYLKDIKYSRTASIGDFVKGRKYLAAYDSLDPKSGLLLEIDITDFKYKFPDNGWKLRNIPIKLDTVYIKEVIK